MQWHSLYLGNGADANAPTTRVQDAFVKWLASHGAPVDAAVFSQLERRDATVTLYFSPAAESFARSVGAVPSDKPSGRPGLLVGDQRAIEQFFPR